VNAREAQLFDLMEDQLRQLRKALVELPIVFQVQHRNLIMETDLLTRRVARFKETSQFV
jgi:hypothetical protein